MLLWFVKDQFRGLSEVLAGQGWPIRWGGQALIRPNSIDLVPGAVRRQIVKQGQPDSDVSRYTGPVSPPVSDLVDHGGTELVVDLAAMYRLSIRMISRLLLPSAVRRST